MPLRPQSPPRFSQMLGNLDVRPTVLDARVSAAQPRNLRHAQPTTAGEGRQPQETWGSASRSKVLVCARQMAERLSSWTFGKKSDALHEPLSEAKG